ncbi:MAG: radical SAM protein [Thermoplasmatales archaeon]|nr:radical SAM protein [Thermoplasmatales archaeon]
MVLGSLYVPSGLALETAQHVLEAENVHACNVAWGCTNKCTDCFIRYSKPGRIRFPKEDPCSLVKKQLDNGLETDGVFISFNTDPLLACNFTNTVQLVNLLQERKIPVAILSKMGAVDVPNIRNGITIKSSDERFRKEFEPNASSIAHRLKVLKKLKDNGEYTWISDEPHPCPDIYKQDDYAFWESINFVDFIIFGKWNYNSLASTDKAQDYYKTVVPQFIDFCNGHGIRYHVKAETMKFIGDKK